MIIMSSTSDDDDMTILGLIFHFRLADDTRAGSTGVSVLTQIININNYKLINNYFDTWVSIWWFSGWWCFVSGGFFAADWNNNQSETRIYMFQPIRREYLPVEVTLTVNIVAAAFLHPSTPVPNLTRLEDTLNNQSEISIAHINQSEESIYLGSLRMLSNHLMMEVSDENSFFSLLSVRTINQSEISKTLYQLIRYQYCFMPEDSIYLWIRDTWEGDVSISDHITRSQCFSGSSLHEVSHLVRGSVPDYDSVTRVEEVLHDTRSRIRNYIFHTSDFM